MSEHEIYFATKNKRGATETVTFDSLRQSSDHHIEPACPDGRYRAVPQITL